MKISLSIDVYAQLLCIPLYVCEGLARAGQKGQDLRTSVESSLAVAADLLTVGQGDVSGVLAMSFQL
jgi:hypothetical protein